MAALLPAVLVAGEGAAVGGAAAAGTAAASGLTIGSVLTGVSALATIASGISQYQQGQATEDQLELAAKETEIQGRLDAITTNEELLKTLSKNSVAAAASGLMSAGSVQRAQEASQAKAAQELAIQRLNTAQEVAATKAKASAAGKAGITSLIGSTITAGDRIASALQVKRKTK